MLRHLLRRASSGSPVFLLEINAEFFPYRFRCPRNLNKMESMRNYGASGRSSKEVHWGCRVNFRAHASQSSAMHAWAAINVTCP
jgi:hypothetical protein